MLPNRLTLFTWKNMKQMSHLRERQAARPYRARLVGSTADAPHLHPRQGGPVTHLHGALLSLIAPLTFAVLASLSWGHWLLPHWGLRQPGDWVSPQLTLCMTPSWDQGHPNGALGQSLYGTRALHFPKMWPALQPSPPFTVILQRTQVPDLLAYCPQLPFPLHSPL